MSWSLDAHLAALSACRRCPNMIGPVITNRPAALPGLDPETGVVTGEHARVILLGQAPGRHEGKVGRPFGWSAGRTLFRWLSQTGPDEERVRERVYIAAVGRCFPGPSRSGTGDRVPDRQEIAACAPWFEAELAGLRPKLIIPVGKLAIGTLLGPVPLELAVGAVLQREIAGEIRDILPLPHPSGASTWFQRSPGKERLAEALLQLGEHPVWRGLFER